MRKIIVIDAETDPFDGKTFVQPFIWGAYDDEFGFRYFDKSSEMVEWLKTQKALVYAHNGGNFDFLFLLDHLEPNTEIRIINGRLSKFKIGKAEFRDSWLILPIPLKGYKKDKIDYSIMSRDQRDKPANRHKIIKYLKSDCEYLHELVSFFIKENGPKLTLASAALSNWKRITGNEPPKTTAAFFEKYGQYYYGGRVECFEKGIIDDKIKVFDVNSAYPFAMIHEHPITSEVIVSDKLPDTRAEIERSFIELEADSLGAFPYHGEKGLSFPADGDIRQFKITGWEYLAALDTGYLKNPNITEVRTFKHTINFKEYVDFYYEKKKNATKGTPEYVTAKLFLNGLYGKFAANPNKYKQFFVCEPKYIEYMEAREGYSLCDFVGPWALMSAPLPEAIKRFYNVATGASITGFVRAYLWRALIRAKRKFYCDTDGIHATAITGIKIGKNLGEWNVEFPEFFVEGDRTLGAYAGKKLYALVHLRGKKIVEKKVASKGVRLNAAQVFKLAKGQTILYKQKAPSMSIRRGVSFLQREIKATI